MGSIEAFDGVAWAVSGDVAMVLWKHGASLERAKWVDQRLTDTTRSLKAGLVYVQLILPSSTPPDARTREHATSTLKRLDGSLRQLVTVPLGDSFWSNVVRAIVRAMVMFTKQVAIHEVASDERDAARRIRARATERTPSERELLDLFGALRAALDRPASASRVGSPSSMN